MLFTSKELEYLFRTEVQFILVLDSEYLRMCVTFINCVIVHVQWMRVEFVTLVAASRIKRRIYRVQISMGLAYRRTTV